MGERGRDGDIGGEMGERGRDGVRGEEMGEGCAGIEVDLTWQLLPHEPSPARLPPPGVCAASRSSGLRVRLPLPALQGLGFRDLTPPGHPNVAERSHIALERCYAKDFAQDGKARRGERRGGEDFAQALERTLYGIGEARG